MKFNLDIVYTPPYEKEKFGIIKRRILILSNVQKIYLIGKKRFSTLMLVRWSLFLIKILSIYFIPCNCNFIPYETVLFDDRDPPWMNKEAKKLIFEKKNIFNCVRQNNNDKQLLDRLKDLQTQLDFQIRKYNWKYYSRITNKLSDIGKSFKTYGSILKSFLTGKKIPYIPPLFENNEYIVNFKKKAELFNSFFANQCSLINNNSKLPPNLP